MAFPTSRYRATAISDQSNLLLKAIIALHNIPYTYAANPLMQVPRDPEVRNTTPSIPVSYTILLTTKEHPHCYVDLSNPDFLNLEGDERFLCQPCEHMTSDDDPCPGSQLCCPCKQGTFLSRENMCGSCIPHTVCDEVKISGNGLRDNVCVVTPSGNIQNATLDRGLLIHPSEELDTGQDAVTDPPLIDPPDTATKREEGNPGQDEGNPGDGYPSWCEHDSHCLNNSTCVELSEQLSKCICMDGWEGESCQRVVTASPDCSILSTKWPWLITVIVLLTIIVASEVHKRRGKSASGGYAIATGENVEMCSVGHVESQGDRNQ